ncbi:MAG: transcriptional regulator [Planctomycetaceae bacterium]|nr:transcriptional regulator [Planctomycetaceae bacterium]
MSDPANALKTTTEDIPREVLDLAEAVHALPAEHRQAIEPFLTRVVDSNRRRRRILVLVQDALSQLRLDMKYLTFDLEATRRERDELRRKLDGTA